MNQDKKSAATAKVGRCILDTVEGLIDHPYQGKPGRLPDTRELVVTRYPYLVVYDVEPATEVYANQPKTISILRVLHGAMQWPQEAERHHPTAGPGP